MSEPGDRAIDMMLQSMQPQQAMLESAAMERERRERACGASLQPGQAMIHGIYDQKRQAPSGQAQQIAARGMGLDGPMHTLPQQTEPPLDSRELDALALLVRSEVLPVASALQSAYRLGKSRGSSPDFGKVAR